MQFYFFDTPHVIIFSLSELRPSVECTPIHSGDLGTAYINSITTTLVYVNARLDIYISTLPSTYDPHGVVRVYSNCDINSGLEVDQINQISSAQTEDDTPDRNRSKKWGNSSRKWNPGRGAERAYFLCREDIKYQPFNASGPELPIQRRKRWASPNTPFPP